MPKRHSFDYAIVRVVPRVDRAEFINAGAILYCRTQRFLAARLALDKDRLLALAPALDQDEVLRNVDVISAICVGAPDSGPIGALSLAERWHWLTSPRSTVVQLSPAHCGLCTDATVALDEIMRRMVL